jgi:hypothetical protein
MQGLDRYRAQGFVILVCADTNFFELARMFEDNLMTVQGSLPVIGDLGLTPEQRARLRSEVIDLNASASFREDSAAGFIKTTHKPAAIRQAIARYGVPCIALDADMLLTRPLRAAEFAGADIAVTPRITKPHKSRDDHANGYLNAGFFYAGMTPEADAFLRRWEARCATEDKSDQEILSEMTSALRHEPFGRALACDGATLMQLSPRIYNDTTRRHGKIMHFKALGRGGKRRKQWLDIAARLQKAPRAYGAWFAVKRRLARLLDGGAGLRPITTRPRYRSLRNP